MKKQIAMKILRTICTNHRTKIRFCKTLKSYGGITVDGLCNPNVKSAIISINKSVSLRCMASAVFHELGHIHCMRKGIWKKFHNQDKYSSVLAFRVENWIEWWAKKEWDKAGMRKLFGHYRFSYKKSHKTHIIKWFKKYYNFS